MLRLLPWYFNVKIVESQGENNMEVREKLIPVNIENEMKSSFLDYSMSVIVSRALPDVRDGLKPVHRRILYTLKDLNLQPNRPYRKCAKIAGDVSGNYHPHGEAIVYPSLVRLAQSFTMRYTLVNGQGNFGSIDGDPPAAMRYTEARMTPICQEMLADIEKETVDFIPNYDNTRTEPRVLPSAIPNLLINGSSGIAVGMATNIPPHNLTEIVDGISAVIKNPDITIKSIMSILPGPDFPTGGFIHGREGIVQAYKTGRGIIQLRARIVREQIPRRKKINLVIKELPYQVNKSNLLKSIADLVKSKKIEGISDLRDESDRDGTRIVIELQKPELEGYILSNLYKHTQLQQSFGIILLAVTEQQPQLFNLKQMIEAFINHRQEVITRRTLYELRKAEEKAHILEGFKKALDHLDKIIALIRASKDPQTAKSSLMKQFAFSEIQAQAILDMRLQRLTRMERNKIIKEYQETLKLIKELEAILADVNKVLNIIMKDLERIKEQYGDERRTEIIEKTRDIELEDTVKEEDMVISCSISGYIKRTPLRTYQKQKRGGKGRIGMSMKEEDFVDSLFVAPNKSYVLIFTSQGKIHWLKVYEIPEVGASGRGKPIVNLINIDRDDKVASLVVVKDFEEDAFITMCSSKGIIKKTPLKDFSHPQSRGIIAMRLNEGESLLDAKLTDGNQTIILGTNQGKASCFKEKEVRSMQRNARGVIAMRLRKDDYLIGMAICRNYGYLLTVTDKGYGKRTSLAEYASHHRGGQGVVNIRLKEKNDRVVAIKWVQDEDEVMIISQQGKIIRFRIKDLRPYGRSTQGMRLMDLGEGDSVVAVAKLAE
jgi:DNA gyrase subunit A